MKWPPTPARPLHLLPVAILAAALAFVSAPAPGLWAAQASYGPSGTPGASGGPNISAVMVSDIGPTSVIVTWTVDVPSASQVDYGTTIAYGETTTPQVSHGCLVHVQDIRELEPGTTYHVRIRATDQQGAEGISEDVLVSTEPEASPLPVPSSTADHTTVFAGDATGVTDVTDALRVFLESNDGARVALAPNGVYAVTQLTFTAHDLVVDFRGARIQGIQPGASGIVRIQSSSNIELNDATVYGTGYGWVRPTRTSTASMWTVARTSSSITRRLETPVETASTPATTPTRTTRPLAS